MTTAYDRQMTHNRAVDYVCDRLSEMGWSANPTPRNEGVHIRCTGEDGRWLHIRAHGCNGRNAITTPAIMPRADFWIIVRFDSDPPKCYILSHAEIASERYEQQGTWWVDPPQYERFQAGWDRLNWGGGLNNIQKGELSDFLLLS